MKQNPKFKEVAKEQADGLAWAFDTKTSSPRPYYFKFPQLQPKQVRLRVLYSSICQTDVKMTRNGVFGQSQPMIPGHEVVGRIQAVGSQVLMRKVGQIVGVGFLKGSCNNCKQCWSGYQQLCSKHPNPRTIYPDIGGFSTHMHIYQDWAFIVPNGIPLQSAPPLFCAGITMYNPLQSKCKKGDKVAIIGIGGLGHLGIILGKMLGMQITAFSRSQQKQKQSKELGAHRYVVSTPENMKKEEYQYDVVILTALIKPNEFEQYFNLAKMSGRICIATGMKQSPQMSFFSLTTTQKQIVGVKCGSKRQVYQMLKLCADNHVVPKCQFYDFMDFEKAFERTQSQNPHFRVVLKVNQDLMSKN